MTPNFLRSAATTQGHGHTSAAMALSQFGVEGVLVPAIELHNEFGVEIAIHSGPQRRHAGDRERRQRAHLELHAAGEIQDVAPSGVITPGSRGIGAGRCRLGRRPLPRPCSAS